MSVHLSHIKESIVNQMNRSFRDAKTIRGTVAFWTIKPDFFDPSFLKLLKNEDSFYCVDYHFPTDINKLSEFVSQHNSNIYLFNHRCSNNKDIHLLHSKMMLLDFEDDLAELWVGSHNWTKTALEGKNVENTVVIRLNKFDELYQTALDQLNKIKDLCVKFVPEDLEYYKTLQDIHNFQNFIQSQAEFSDSEVIEVRKMFLIGRNIEALNAKEDTLLLLGNDDFKIKNLVFKTKIIIHTLDIDSNQENIFEAEITNFGKINERETKSYEITFSERFIALRSDEMIPFVFSNQSQIIGKEQLKACKYFINLRLFKKKALLT